MSKIVIGKKHITVIWRGKNKTKWIGQTIATDKHFNTELRKYIKRPTFKQLGKLMNTTTPHTRGGFRDAIYENYFFIMYLIWALEKKNGPLIIKDEEKTTHKRG